MIASDAYVSATKMSAYKCNEDRATYPSEAIQSALQTHLEHLLLPNHRTRITCTRLPWNEQYFNHEHRNTTVCEVFPTKEETEGFDSRCGVGLCESEEARDERGGNMCGEKGASLTARER